MILVDDSAVAAVHQDSKEDDHLQPHTTQDAGGALHADVSRDNAKQPPAAGAAPPAPTPSTTALPPTPSPALTPSSSFQSQLSSPASSLLWSAGVVEVSLTSLTAFFRFFLMDYSTRSGRAHPVTAGLASDCVQLFALDYHIATLNNAQGEYCASYPPALVIMEAERCHPSSSTSSSSSSQATVAKVNSASELSALFRSSRFNRVHGRFVCPVLLCRGVNVSRSSTLSVPAEAMFNNVATRTKELFGTLYESMSSSFRTQPTASPTLPLSSSPTPPSTVPSAPDASPVSARVADEQLLSRLSTRFIIDLMVEHRKKKLGLTLTSSEKSESSAATSGLSSSPAVLSAAAAAAGAAPRPYRDFVIVPTPYPGCEFFALYHANRRSPLGLVFDWSQSYVDSLLQLEGVAGMGRMELSGEAGEEDGLYEQDTHFACWEQQQREQQTKHADSNGHRPAVAPAPVVNGVTEETKQDASGTVPAAAMAVESAPVVGAYGSSCALSSQPVPALARLHDAVQGQEEDDDGARGRIRPPAEAVGAGSTDASTLLWADYKDWSIVTLTKNYLSLLLFTLSSPAPSGLSIHCVSGWDRTPLFISLLRLSLWADGEVHASLSASAVLFLTLAYDWCLFSHHLHDRHGKQEDIMYFAFDVLQYITAAKFSLNAITAKRRARRRRHAATTAAAPLLSDEPPAGGMGVHDGYFTAESAAAALPSYSSVVSASAAASSQPIPIPRPARTSSPTLQLSMQPASLSPRTERPVHRGGSWTMIDVMLPTESPAAALFSSHSPPSGSPVQLDGDDALGAAAAAGRDKGGIKSASWTAGWKSDSAEETEHGGEEDAEDPAAQGDADGRRPAAIRCERLMAVRTLFLQMYHAVLPVSPSCPVAPILPNAPICPHYDSAARAQANLPTTVISTAPPVAAASSPCSLAVPAAGFATDPAPTTSGAVSSWPVAVAAAAAAEPCRPLKGETAVASKTALSRMTLLGWMPF